LASSGQPLIPLIADHVCEQHIHQRPASVSATGDARLGIELGDGDLPFGVHHLRLRRG
jgi:hypothetical protein